MLRPLLTTLIGALFTAFTVTALQAPVEPPTFHVAAPVVHVRSPDIHLSSPDIHVSSPDIHVSSPEVHVAAAPVNAKKPGPFIVHEWGTFNHMQGAPGATITGMQHEDEVLPDFVHSVTDAHASPWARFGDESLHVQAERVSSKMETPVLYFYSDIKRRAQVDVRFHRGLMSEWYPNATIAPERAPIDLSKIEETQLVWDIDVLPRGEVPGGVPHVDEGETWSIARRPNASYVQTDNGEAERYLFYRGLGDHDLPLYVRSAHDDQVCVGSSVELGYAVALEVRGKSARFARVSDVNGSASRAEFGRFRSRDRVVKDIKRSVRDALVGEGLYKDEADAMVDTWTKTWFEAEGARVLYILPRTFTDRILPLSITPKPDELERVLVGRLELLMPKDEREIIEALNANDREALAKRGRFLEPILRSVEKWNADNKVKATATTMLKELQN